MNHVEEIKKFLVERVEALQGVKGTELVADVISKLREDSKLMEIFGGYLAGDDIDLPNLLDELVSEKRIVEIEYTVPQVSYRLKSFYLPVGSTVRYDEQR